MSHSDPKMMGGGGGKGSRLKNPKVHLNLAAWCSLQPVVLARAVPGLWIVPFY